jgi:hypothetical protein
MTNDFTNVSPTRLGKLWEPVYPMKRGELIDDAPDLSSLLFERQRQQLFQELEDARLSHVLINAWNECYETIDEVIEDVLLEASKLGITVVGDVVDLGERWEDILQIKDGELGFRVRE